MTILGSDHCPGCGAPLPDDPNGAHHRYMTSSSGCWETFGQVLAREFSEPGWFAEHRLTVDTYAAQHPGEDDRRQRQSVALHLIALCHRLEHRLDAEALLRSLPSGPPASSPGRPPRPQRSTSPWFDSGRMRRGRPGAGHMLRSAPGRWRRSPMSAAVRIVHMFDSPGVPAAIS